VPSSQSGVPSSVVKMQVVHAASKFGSRLRFKAEGNAELAERLI
jgi:hypothetical protein